MLLQSETNSLIADNCLELTSFVFPDSLSYNNSPMHASTVKPLSRAFLVLIATSLSVSWYRLLLSECPVRVYLIPISLIISAECSPVNAPSLVSERFYVATWTLFLSAAYTVERWRNVGATTTSTFFGSNTSLFRTSFGNWVANFKLPLHFQFPPTINLLIAILFLFLSLKFNLYSLFNNIFSNI